MATFVLVPGAWLGGWCWQRVARFLRENGHDVYSVTLTGLGERSHLSTREVDLETHIEDVVNLIEFEDLRDVILVGHSYAGIVVTGASDRVGSRLSHLVYVDSGPVPDGTSYLETQSPDARQFIERQVNEHGDGWQLSPLSPEDLQNVLGASLEGIDQNSLQLMREKATPQPSATYTQPLKLRNTDKSEQFTKVLISNSFPLEQIRELISSGHPWFRDLAGDEWRLEEMPTGHWPMFSRPKDLAEKMLEVSE